MKPHALWNLIFFLPLVGLGQSQADLITTFYDLPLNHSRLKIKKQIISDHRFSAIAKDSSFNNSDGNLYSGNIIQHNLPSGFQIDSANIILTRGYQDKNKKLTIIRLYYYVPNQTTSDSLMTWLWNKVKTISYDTSRANISNNDTHFSEQEIRIKMKRRKYLPQVGIVQQVYSQKTFIVSIEYERSGN